MKFGRQLAELVDPKFRNYCVSYNKLKGFIRESDSKAGHVIQTIQDVTSAAVPFLPPAPAEQLPSVLFQEALESELAKVNTFAELQQETLFADIGAVVRRIRSIDRESEEFEQNREQLEDELSRVADLVCAFARFIRLNYTAFRKITKKESKVHRSSSATWFMANVARAPFMTVDFDRLSMSISVGFELLRNPLPLIEATPVARHPSTDSNKVLSAWVSEDDLWDVKIALAERLSLDLVSTAGARQGMLDSILSTGAQKDAFVSAKRKVTATYYDAPWLESYKVQLGGQFGQGFQSERIDDSVSISFPSGNRLTLSSADWDQLWAHPSPSDLIDPDITDELTQLRAAGFEPLVTCTYDRYQFYADEGDSAVAFEVRIEENAVFTTKSGEKLDDRNSIFTGHALYITVPRSAAQEPLPEYLMEITGMPGVTEVGSFSKRVHGLFMYGDNRTGEGLPFPPWATQKPSTTGRTRTVQSTPRTTHPVTFEVRPEIFPQQTRLDRAREEAGAGVRERVEDAWRRVVVFVWWLVGSGREAIGGSGGASVRDAMIKIEPKSFFACERNLLDWTHNCVVVTGLAYVVGGAVGVTVAAVPIGVLLWEIRLHRVRTNAMMNKENIDYSDRVGPTMLYCSIIVLAMKIFVSSFLGIWSTPPLPLTP